MQKLKHSRNSANQDKFQQIEFVLFSFKKRCKMALFRF